MHFVSIILIGSSFSLLFGSYERTKKRYLYTIGSAFALLVSGLLLMTKIGLFDAGVFPIWIKLKISILIGLLLNLFFLKRYRKSWLSMIYYGLISIICYAVYLAIKKPF